MIASWYTGSREKSVMFASWKTEKGLYAPVASLKAYISRLDNSVYMNILVAEKGLNGAYTALQGEQAEMKAVQLYRVRR